MFETHMTFVGNLITDVNRRQLTDGTTYVTFRVARTERRLDRESGTWVDGDAVYLSVTCWRQLAENVLRSFTIGDPIIIRGRLRTRKYEDKEGHHREVTELEGLSVGPDLNRAIARITRLDRDGMPRVKAPQDVDEQHGDGATGMPGSDSERSAGRMSDDPWAPSDGDSVELAELVTEPA